VRMKTIRRNSASEKLLKIISENFT